MIKQCFAAIGNSVRDVFRHPAALSVCAAAYLLCLGSAYWFISSGVGTAFQLVITTVTALAAPLLLIFLAGSVGSFGAGETSPGRIVIWALKYLWAVIIVAIPLVALTILLVYLFNKIQMHLPAETQSRPLTPSGRPHGRPAMPFHWPQVLLGAARIFVFGVVLPSIAAHFLVWLGRFGFLRMLRNFFTVLGRSLSARGLITFAIGAVIFAIVPYFTIFARTPVKSGWLELSIFGLRMLLAFLLTLVGVLITMRALGRISVDPPAEPVVPEAPAVVSPAKAA